MNAPALNAKCEKKLLMHATVTAGGDSVAVVRKQAGPNEHKEDYNIWGVYKTSLRQFPANHRIY